MLGCRIGTTRSARQSARNHQALRAQCRFRTDCHRETPSRGSHPAGPSCHAAAIFTTTLYARREPRHGSCMANRIERDSMGEVEVPSERYYGAQTARSLANFPIGGERMPAELIAALALIKKAAARVNRDARRARAAAVRADLRAPPTRCIAGEARRATSRSSVWQTGCGTQTNMNVNEVHRATAANELAGGARGGKQPVHPNDHVNRSQSSNDVFPTAMHVAAVLAIEEHLLPARRARCATRSPTRAARSPTSSRSAARTCRTRRRSRSARRSPAGSRSSITRGARSTPRCRSCASSRSAAPRSAPASTRTPSYADARRRASSRELDRHARS